MKISLGIDFNKIRTIISFYSPKNSRIKMIYNEPSCGMVLKRGSGQAFYGDLVLMQEGVGYAYNFYPSLYIPKEELLLPYFRYIFSKIFNDLNNDIIEVEYIVFTSGTLDYKIKESVFPYLKSTFRELENTRLIFSKAKEVLNLSIIHSLNQVGKIEEENILVLSLNDDNYCASLFNYNQKNIIPISTTPISMSYSVDGFSKFAFGSYGLIDSMITHAVDKQDINIKANFKKNEMTFSKFSLIRELEDKMIENQGNLSNIFLGRTRINYIVGKEKYPFILSQEDYDYALENELYSKNESLRKYLKGIKELTKNQTYKVICQGKMTVYRDVMALIQAIFGSSRIIPYQKISSEKLEKIVDFSYVSKGCALQSGFRYQGVLPSVSYKDYRGLNVPILNKDDDFILSETEKGSFFYRLNKELEIPLKTILSKNEEGYSIYINHKEYNLLDYLYDRGSLRASHSYDRKMESFIATLRIGIVEKKDHNNLLITLHNTANNYYYEFELEVE